ncbi:NAD-dependent epimerase/dehydratase family protein [Jannaschia sp. CCS1]|uniref:NAD-dependent epimerase/dehydratase family protein n=1 Tax=Jannaschia sp. (strain CCS1) TaxID=290400 RepID=UPI0002EC1D93|nr:NAD-dependent epimerase/dehydratase family protein [Jannaschia sp. CCS1]
MTRGKVLITGRHGFTGHYVARALSAAGWQVWSMSNHAPADPDPHDRVADLTDAAAVAAAIADIRPDAVVHLAAIAFVAHGSADDFYRVNLMGTRNLLEALVHEGCGAQGVVLASSANIYGNTRISPIPETAQPAPANDYAVSKLAMEHVAELFAGKLPLVIARPFNYTGVGQASKFLVPKIVAGFRERAPRLELGNLDVARDFSDVRDVAQVYRALLESEDARGETVNICSGHATSLQEIVGLCRKLSGHDLEIVVNPDFVRDDEIKVLKGDPTRMTALTPGLTRHGFKDTLRWMLEA